MTETQLSVQSRAARNAVGAFLEVCEKFAEVSKNRQSGYLPVYGGQWNLLKYFARHPIRFYTETFRTAISAQSSLGILVSSFPVQTMTDFLARFSEPELKAIKTLSEIQLRRLKSLITDNPLLKFSVPVGSAYALLRFSTDVIKKPGFEMEMLKSIFELSVVQSLTGSLLVGFIGGLVLLCLQYLFLTIPAIGRAQILDDLLQIALEEKRFAAAGVGEAAAAGLAANSESGSSAARMPAG